MAVSTEELAEIGRTLSAPDAETAGLAALRQSFPNLFWARCDASDVTDAPYQTHGPFDVHLLDGSNHCIETTLDPGRATGIVLARRSTTP